MSFVTYLILEEEIPSLENGYVLVSKKSLLGLFSWCKVCGDELEKKQWCKGQEVNDFIFIHKTSK